MITIINIIIVNIIVLLALSYFWSGWNFRVFKPWLWLEARKRKQLNGDIEAAERRAQDKNRFYAHWFALEQIDANHVPGMVLIAGSEDADTVILVNRHSPDRSLTVIDLFADRDVEIVRENCQGEVSRQQIHIKGINLDSLKASIGNATNVSFVKGHLADEVKNLSSSIAFASIDTVDYDELSSTLSAVYPLLSEGGIIIVHDYNHNWDTVRQAVDHFEASVAERFLWLPDMYGSAVLVKNKAR